jgi:hypothetical protein
MTHHHKHHKKHPEHHITHGATSTAPLPKGRSSKPTYGNGDAKPKLDGAETDARVAQTVLELAREVLDEESRDKELAAAPADYVNALLELRDAKGKHGSSKFSATERLAKLDAAMAGLAPVIAAYRDVDGGPEWVQDHVLQRVAWLTDDLKQAQARARVENSIRVGPDKIFELPDDPHEQGRVLHAAIQKLLPTIAKVNEQVLRVDHHLIEHQAEEMVIEGEAHNGKLKTGSLVELQNTLVVIDGFLTLTDEEFTKKLHEVQTEWKAVATYAELVKAVTEVAGGALAMTFSGVSLLARAVGDPASATIASGASRAIGLHLGNIIAGIELVHGFATMFDSTASRQERIDGGVDAAGSAAWLIGKRFSVGVGASASGAIFLGYAELKWMLNEFWATSHAIVAAQMRGPFERIEWAAESIATKSDLLVKAGMLLRDEQNTAKATELKRVEATYAASLGGAVDGLISDCRPRRTVGGEMHYPGEFSLLREVFAPVMKHEHATTPEAATEAAKVALERITWSLAHAEDIVNVAAAEGDLADVESDIAEQEAAKQPAPAPKEDVNLVEGGDRPYDRHH